MEGNNIRIVLIGVLAAVMLLFGCTRYFASLDDLLAYLDGETVPTAEERGIRAK